MEKEMDETIEVKRKGDSVLFEKKRLSTLEMTDEEAEKQVKGLKDRFDFLKKSLDELNLNDWLKQSRKDYKKRKKELKIEKDSVDKVLKKFGKVMTK